MRNTLKVVDAPEPTMANRFKNNMHPVNPRLLKESVLISDREMAAYRWTSLKIAHMAKYGDDLLRSVDRKESDAYRKTYLIAAIPIGIITAILIIKQFIS